MRLIIDSIHHKNVNPHFIDLQMFLKSELLQ